MAFKTFQINIYGVVQGVGFRPFIFNLACENKLHGEVCNTTSGLTIRINAESINEIHDFIEQIKNKKPDPTVIEKIKVKQIKDLPFDDFKIIKSRLTSEKFQLVSPDLATCSKCIADIKKVDNKRRFNYAFTNCTNCGPRFTIIKKLPYDRKNTTMSDFKMCSDCSKEYADPVNRRFHAQPNACKQCGPHLILVNKEGKTIDDKNPIISAAQKILKGKIIGIKSLGGFQIACDATSDKAVLSLRKKKKRPFKPFAIMMKNTYRIMQYFYLSKAEKKILSSAKAPIVLLKKKENCESNNNLYKLHENKLSDIADMKEIPLKVAISKYVSFDNKYEGIMLPYTPLHHLLFKEINRPLVMTSGNIAEEPIVFKNETALNKLNNICDYFLLHDREIYSRFDDSVVKVFNGKEMLVRRARGYAPFPLKIKPNIKNKSVLATGSEEKNTFCIIKKNYAIISQHIGDMDNADSMDFFESTLSNYKTLFGIENLNLAVYDKHPAFRLKNLVLRYPVSGSELVVQHHKAHIASVIAENEITEKVIGFAWDGTGYGDDGKIWGSEIFVVDEKLYFDRVGHLMEKILPGGEITINKPYRMAVSYIYYFWTRLMANYDLQKDIKLTNKSTPHSPNDFIKYIRSNFHNLHKVIGNKEILSIIFQIKTKFNSVETTSMGRLFDALSSILNLTHSSSFEGEAAINLEMAAQEKIADYYPFKYVDPDNNRLTGNKQSAARKMSIFIIDDIDLFSKILKDIFIGIKTNTISAKFHNTLSEIILDISKRIREKYSINNVVLSGGVFQNNYLIEKTFNLLKKNGFNVYTNYKVPVNDGGISLGQAFIGIKNAINLKE